MATLVSPRVSSLPTWVTGRQAVPLVLLLAAVALRFPHLGDPAYMIDEQFYLVAGDRLLHGAIPYVDFWDRKPVGLFLIYAVAAAFGRGAVLAYQLMALGCAAATAIVIARMTRPMAGSGGGLIAGLLYLVWIELLEGGGGQSPIFYNLPMACAGWAVLTAGGTGDDRRHRRLALAAMALVGVAIQIKYTAVFEGMFLSLVLSWWALRRTPSLSKATTRIILLAAMALMPTAIALGFYVAIGQARLFIFSNFISIFLRGPTPSGMLFDRVEMILLMLSPFAVCTAASVWLLRDHRDAAAIQWRMVTTGWCAAALAGLFSVGTLYMHYVLPVLIPFTTAAAPIFRRRGIGPLLALLSATLPVLNLHYPDLARTTTHQRQIAALTALMPSGVDKGCLQMFDGPSILYWTSHACSVTRFVFPDHLSAANEANAMGIDTVTELGAILAHAPLAITIGQPDPHMVNRRTYKMLRAALPRAYRLAGVSPFDGHEIEVWIRR